MQVKHGICNFKFYYYICWREGRKKAGREGGEEEGRQGGQEHSCHFRA